MTTYRRTLRTVLNGLVVLSMLSTSLPIPRVSAASIAGSQGTIDSSELPSSSFFQQGEPTPTETPTDIPPDTATPTPTETETPSPTATETATATDTPPPTDTPTPSATPAETETPTPTSTQTPTTAPSDTDTPTPTATPTESPTVTETATPTPTGTPTPTPDASLLSLPFSDDMEAGPDNWLAGGSWALVGDAHSGEHAWTDSPDGNYTHGSDATLTLDGQLDLSDSAAPRLVFWDTYALAAYDRAYVDVFTDNGQTWTAHQIHYYSSNTGWTRHKPGPVAIRRRADRPALPVGRPEPRQRGRRLDHRRRDHRRNTQPHHPQPALH